MEKLNNQNGGNFRDAAYNYDRQIVQYITEEEYLANPTKFLILDQENKKILSTMNNLNIIKAINKHGLNKFYNVGIEPIQYIFDDYMNKGSWLDSNLYHNPLGLWFGCGADWQKYVDFPSVWSFSTHLYEIEINDSVKKISSVDELKKFINKYKNDKDISVTNVINWEKVKNDYDGIVICPYLGNDIWGINANKFSLRGNEEAINEYVKKIAGQSWKDNIIFSAEWYRHWETGSGVVWKTTGIKDFRLVERMNTFDKENINTIIKQN